MGDELKNEAECCSSSTQECSARPQSPVRERRTRSRWRDISMNKETRAEYYVNEQLANIPAPTVDLAPLDKSEQKYSSKARLFVGALPPIATEEDIKGLFAAYGEIGEVFVNNAKNFAFVGMDYYVNALKAKLALNGHHLNGKYLIVNFAQTATVLISNLPPYVSDELLHIAFSVFGDIEQCVVLTDRHGRSVGKATVCFVKKGSATLAKRRCEEGSFFLTSHLKPVVIEEYDTWNVMDGISEKQIRKTNEYYQSREQAPRFAVPGSFEHEYGKRWKDLIQRYKQKKDALKNELVYEEARLEKDLMRAQYDHETERLKELLRRREIEKQRLYEEWNYHPCGIYGTNAGDDEQDERVVATKALFDQADQLSRMLENQEQDIEKKLEEQLPTSAWTDDTPLTFQYPPPKRPRN